MTKNGRIKILLDVDTGVDDAYTLLLAFRCDRFDVVGVTTVAGNMSVDVVTQNTLIVLDAANAPLNVPVCKGAAWPLIEKHHFCPEIHGSDGLGELHRSPSKQRSIQKSVAAMFIVDAATRIFENNNDSSSTSSNNEKQNTHSPSSSPPPPPPHDRRERLTIVALAPLTNLALAFRLDPSLSTKIERIVLMGGASRNGGNATPWAEANIRDDPEAAHIVFTSGIDIVMYPWDVFEQFSFDRVAAEQFANSKNDWSQLAGQLMLSDMNRFGLSQATLGDAGTLVYMLDPSAVELESRHVAIELQGTHTRGMTVVDLRGRVYEPDQLKRPENARVITKINVARFREIYRQYIN